MIFRDDDIQESTALDVFRAADAPFKLHGIPHTIAVITSGLENNKFVLDYIRANAHIIPQLHCHTHEKPFTELTPPQLKDQFSRGIEIMRKLFGVAPSVFYPPWNKSNSDIEDIATRCGLITSSAKISLEQYVRADGDVLCNTINFHYWNLIRDHKALDAAVAVYVKRRTQGKHL